MRLTALETQLPQDAPRIAFSLSHAVTFPLRTQRVSRSWGGGRKTEQGRCRKSLVCHYSTVLRHNSNVLSQYSGGGGRNRTSQVRFQGLFGTIGRSTQALPGRTPAVLRHSCLLAISFAIQDVCRGIPVVVLDRLPFQDPGSLFTLGALKNGPFGVT